MSEQKISYDDFFNDIHVKLLTFYIQTETHTKPEIQAREVQCLYGIQIMSAKQQHPGGKFIIDVIRRLTRLQVQ